MTTRLLVVADTEKVASLWAERNVRFTIGFDDVVKASVDQVTAYAKAIVGAPDDAGDVFDGLVLVRSPGPGHSPRRSRLLSVLRHVVAEANIVVAPAPLPGGEG